jgi:LacI family transcriptional regulator
LEDPSAAILLVGTELNENDAKIFAQTDIPLVLLDCNFADLPFHAVLMENRHSVSRAVSYLASLGHEKIGYLQGDVSSPNGDERYEGYEQGMAKHNLSVEKKYLFSLPVSITGAYEYFDGLIAKGVELPTAFVAYNDMVALGVMQALQKHHIRVPEDVSVIGFDDIEFSAVFAPGLTTIKVHTKELGELAVQKLLQLAKNPGSIHTKTQMYTDFVVRGSTAAPAAG